MRRVCILTGTRAEYGLLKPVMEAVEEHPDLELSMIATGMHLSEKFGMTERDITKDGFKIDARVELMPKDDQGMSASIALGEGVAGMARALGRINPDVLVVLGDRMEPLAGALAATYMNIPIAHIHGGDV
ncbi:MAG: UDP-N-acetylglucosamine 2-epimerase, partial [Candidatus Altiarchaeota archaeon]|nr:UDP-N-acetylglucosamine 2-epimerase [Candidatus Altiarchaeota archaeon]